jgi:hypothetical protein
MPRRTRLLISGLLFMVLAAAWFGWFVFEPFTEKAFGPNKHGPQTQGSDAPLEAASGHDPKR